uniref:Uncharacterized protein n=1 Tax=Arundo donax TaxID=35708 RepID=A0A0A9HSJ7_ARUDO
MNGRVRIGAPQCQRRRRGKQMKPAGRYGQEKRISRKAEFKRRQEQKKNRGTPSLCRPSVLPC